MKFWDQMHDLSFLTIYQMKTKQNKTKPSIRKIKYLFQSHSASKWQSQDLSMDVYSHTTKRIYLHVSKLYAKLPSSLFFFKNSYNSDTSFSFSTLKAGFGKGDDSW